VIDDDLMAEALKLSQLKTKKAVVETALRLLIRIKKQERLKSLRGKLYWDGDLDVVFFGPAFDLGHGFRVNAPVAKRSGEVNCLPKGSI
jgi:hypothetical protein